MAKYELSPDQKMALDNARYELGGIEGRAATLYASLMDARVPAEIRDRLGLAKIESLASNARRRVQQINP